MQRQRYSRYKQMFLLSGAHSRFEELGVVIQVGWREYKVVRRMQCLGAERFISRQEGVSDSSELDTVEVPAALNCLSAGRSRVHQGDVSLS